MKQLFLLIVIFQFLTANSQRGNNWQFGNKAGLDFNSGTAVATNYSQMVQLEGCSSISDINGQLLFYSDGIKVWNRNNIVMPNGTGLWGNVSSSQSSMIVPFPADSNRYYIFTVDAQGGPKGLCYSVVNITLDVGYGDVEQKNIQLITPTCEKITSVNHCNGKDVWVIAHLNNSDKIYSYLVTSTGVNAPVISSTGTIGSAIGYLKASPDGTRLANANAYNGGLQLYDFNSTTGVVSNKKVIYSSSPTYYGSYGVEFSPNSQILYVCHGRPSPTPNWHYSELRQYSYLDSSVAKINSTKVVLGADSTFFIQHQYSALQLGPDGKIYLSIHGLQSLSVINQPNISGNLCSFTKYSMPLASNTLALYGLPDFNQSYFKGSFTYKTSCTTTAADFFYTRPNNSPSVRWDFGDPLSGNNNTSNLDSPTHIFTSSGMYVVKAIVAGPCRNDTLVKTITIDPLYVNLGPDTSICTDSLFVLNPQSGSNRTYLWQNNSTNSTLTAGSSGLFWVEVTNPGIGCKVRDSMLLTRKPNPIKLLGNDTTVCERTTLLLDAGNAGANYIWQDNSQSQTFLVRDAGTYFVRVNLDGCVSSDTINIQKKLIPKMYLGNDTAICDGMIIVLKPFLNHARNAEFLWSTGDTSSSIAVSQAGNYSLVVKNECGNAADGIIVKQGVCKLFVPTAFTPNNDGKNDIFKPGYGENIVQYSMEIFNRWGEKVFTSNKISDEWNGKLKGILQPNGVYVWFIRYKIDNDPKEYTQKGNVTLIY